MHCRLLIPDLLMDVRPGVTEAAHEGGWSAAIADARAPALELLLARGRRHVDDWQGFEPWMLEAFAVGRQADWPSAPFEVLGSDHAPGDAYWCHAEPLQLQAEGGNVQVGDAPPDLSEAELHSLVASINEHFGETLHLEVFGATQCYARLAAPPEGAPKPPWLLRGRIEPDAAPLAWHRLTNEVQMLLHEHPVNESREARGLHGVNGFWFWGGGRLSTATSPGLKAMVSEEPLSTGLAKSTDVRHSRIPRDMNAWLEQGGNEGVHLFVLDGLMKPAGHRDALRWKEALAALDERVATPLLAALRTNRIGMITVHASSSKRLVNSESTRADLRHFWRRPRPLARQPVAG